MPNREQILALLETISNELMIVAGIFHMLVLGFIIAFGAGGDLQKRFQDYWSLPLLSVSLIAWSYGNPFNGGIFSLFFPLLFLFYFKLSNEQTTIANGWTLFLAMAMILFGLFYPHFLNTSSLMYLIAAPTGLIPCPTLSLIIGFALLFNNFGSKTWSLILSLIGLFYGVFGVLKLHVFIDGILLAGSLILLTATLKPRAQKRL